MLLFLVTPCLAAAVQPCMEWIPIKKMCFLWATCGEKGSQYARSEQGHFERNLSIQFHILHSMRSHPYLKTIWGWSYTCLGYLRHYNNLEKLPPSVLISINLPILIFSTFRAFNYYFIMGSMNYFGQMVLKILKIN